MTLAFVGLGVMGAPMAGHLLAAGHGLRVYTRTRAKADRLARRGATVCPSAAEAARGAEIVFVCVRDTPDVQQVVTGESGILSGAAPGTIIVDHSTISPATTRELAQACAAKDVRFVDAPVSGGDIGAQNAALSIMVGADEATFSRVEPLLRLMGKTITRTGPVGTGQLTKLVNQILVSVTNLAVCEALTFAKCNGLDPDATLSALAGGAAGSWQLSNLGPRMLAGDFRPGFTIDLQQKDLNLVLEAALRGNVSLPATALVHQLFTAAQAAGHGKDGTQALFKVVESLADVH